LNGVDTGSSGAKGVMFMLRANRDISIKSFAFYTYNVRNDWITIYKLRGGGNYTDPASVWDTVPIYNNYITYMGQTTLTTLGDFLNPVMITAGQVQSFYIVSRNYIMYNTATGNGEGITPVSQDGALILYQGEINAAICAYNLSFKG
jgi:hypothetical protein